MARSTAVNHTTYPYPMANAATDLFKKEDVQGLALAHDMHDHSSGKGLAVAIPNGYITSAMILDGTIQDADIGGVGGNKVNWAAAIDSSVPGSKIQDGGITTAKLASNAATALLSWVVSTTPYSTTTTGSYLALPCVTPSLTMLGGAAFITVHGGFSCYHSVASAGVYAGIFVDGAIYASALAFANLGAAGQSNYLHWSYMFQMGGTHTLALGLYNASAGTLTINTASYMQLLVVEHRR